MKQVTVDLKPSDKAALRWAAEKADEWYGSVTGDDGAERAHKKAMKKVNIALRKLQVRPVKERE